MTDYYSFRCEKLDPSLRKKVEKLKKHLDCTNNNELLTKLVEQYVYLEEETEKKVAKLIKFHDYTRQSLIAPMIERYVNKTLKGYGLVKDTPERTKKTDADTKIIIEDLIKYYESKPIKERRYITASMVTKFINKFDDKYKGKHISVIQRNLAINGKIIDEYHKRNKLKLESNLLNRNRIKKTIINR